MLKRGRDSLKSNKESLWLALCCMMKKTYSTMLDLSLSSIYLLLTILLVEQDRSKVVISQKVLGSDLYPEMLLPTQLGLFEPS